MLWVLTALQYKKGEIMKLQVVRTQFGKDATNGMLFINGIFECFTLEDQYQEVKVMHETCIPEGEYEIKLRTVGGFNERYTKKYPTMHRCMLWLQDFPGFEYILINHAIRSKHIIALFEYIWINWCFENYDGYEF